MIINVFMKHQILFVRTILSACTQTCTHTPVHGDEVEEDWHKMESMASLLF